VVRILEVLEEEHGLVIAYSTLTRLVSKLELREDRKKQRVGSYSFGPGEEMQHDTTTHRILFGEKRVTAQCASLIIGYSRKLFIQYYPAFTRFEAKVFLTEAFRFMDGACPRCIIDNTSVIVARGSGPDAEMAPEMESFGQIFGLQFQAHHIGDADRKAKVERNFSYVEGNFLAARTFTDWHDLNNQARKWCLEVANRKIKRSLGMSPDEAYLAEKPYLQPLPPYIPPVYQSFNRVVDVESYVTLDTNRYSVPENLIGKQVELHKTWERLLVFFKRQKVADHPRLIDKRDGRITAPGHHKSRSRKTAFKGHSKEEKLLRGHDDTLDAYVVELKKRSPGRGARNMQRLLELKRTYPQKPFMSALRKALHYGLYDLNRLEQMILSQVAGDYFNLDEDDDH